MPFAPEVSMVIPTYNSSSWISELVGHVAKDLHCQGLELVIVDDGSEDRTWSELKDLSELFPWVQGLKLASNVGQKKQRLLGCIGRGEIIG